MGSNREIRAFFIADQPIVKLRQKTSIHDSERQTVVAAVVAQIEILGARVMSESESRVLEDLSGEGLLCVEGQTEGLPVSYAVQVVQEFSVIRHLSGSASR